MDFGRGTLICEGRVTPEVYGHLDSYWEMKAGRKMLKGELTYCVDIVHSIPCEPSSTELIKCALEVVQNNSITEAFEHEA